MVVQRRTRRELPKKTLDFRIAPLLAAAATKPRAALVVLAALALAPAGVSRPAASVSGAAGGSWRPLPSAPLAARSGHTAVWTGREMIVFGGVGASGEFADGAAYSPATGRWRRIRRAPLAPREGHVAVWTGRELLVWGGGAKGMLRSFADGAAYDPRRDRWRRLARSPLSARFGHTAVWTGREMIIFGGFTSADESGEAAAYDPRRDSWRTLAGWRERHGHAAVWTGRELLVWGGDGPQDHERDGAAYDPRHDRWRALPRSPLEGRASHSAVWTGDELLVVGGASNLRLRVESAAFRPRTNRWRRLPQSPAGWPSAHRAVWTGSRLIVWGGASGAASYDPAANRWAMLPAAPLRTRFEHTAVWTGRAMLVWGGESCPDACSTATVPPSPSGSGCGRLLLFPPPREKEIVDDPVASAFRRHYGQVYRFLRRRTESDEVAEDLAQAVFADAAARLRHLERDGPPVLAWLYTVARRRLVDNARAGARGPGRIATLDEARAQAVEAAPEYGDRLSAAIALAVADLPEGQRQVVVLKLLEGRSFAEIAARLGVTEAACKMRFSRGLEALRAELSRQGVEPR